jgi:NAD(P)H:quinone oxidoreductase type IV
MYGHVQEMAEAEKKGIEAAGGTADIYQYVDRCQLMKYPYALKEYLHCRIKARLTFERRIAETLPEEALTKMYAPPKSLYPIAEPEKLLEYDAFLFGIPTRFGNFPAQWKAFWDSTGGIWGSGGYWGKHAGVFVSTSTPGGGQESTVISAMSTFAHHGLIYVPLGYKTSFHLLSNIMETRGGSPWGAGTFSICR